MRGHRIGVKEIEQAHGAKPGKPNYSMNIHSVSLVSTSEKHLLKMFYACFFSRTCINENAKDDMVSLAETNQLSNLELTSSCCKHSPQIFKFNSSEEFLSIRRESPPSMERIIIIQ